MLYHLDLKVTHEVSLVTGNYLRWRMPIFMRQCWGLLHKLAQLHKTAGMGKLINAALLSLINEACVSVSSLARLCAGTIE